MRVLVTGSQGFVGQHLMRALRNEDHEVVEADRKSGQDLTDLEVAYAVMQPGVDLVFHLAATCSTSGSVRDPMTTFRDTVVTAVNIVESARHTLTPVIFTSSVKARDGMTPYGAAKRMGETWATEYRSAYGLPIIINRPGTIYGPGQEGSDESGWIAWFCKARDADVPVVINGDGQQRRDLLHVSDYVRLLVTQANNIARYDGGLFDIGGGPENTVSVQQIADHLGLVYSYGPDRYGDSREYMGENTVPGWEPEVLWSESETLGVQHD